MTPKSGKKVEYDYDLAVGGARYYVDGSFTKEERAEVKEYLRTEFDPVAITFDNTPLSV